MGAKTVKERCNKMSEKAIGAIVTYCYEGDGDEFEGYVSFLKYDEDADTDSSGKPDDEVFMYYTSVAELEADVWKRSYVDPYITGIETIIYAEGESE
jgi:hypothetical protein